MKPNTTKHIRFTLITSFAVLLGMLTFPSVQAQNWQTAGNVVNPNEFIGSTNLADVILKTNNAERIRITPTGDVGIGTFPDPVLARLHIQAGAVLAEGTQGGTPISGAGTRMMWVPEKAAFRAGSVGLDQWDDVYIGMNSIALGQNVGATGANSTSFGTDAYAFGTSSMTLGRFIATADNGQDAQNMVIGSGHSITKPLFNFKPNSLMVGFNSNLSTLFVEGAPGPGEIGKVGIGTNSPSATLAINSGSDAELDFTQGEGFFIIGRPGSTNIVMDDNDIMARDNANNSARPFFTSPLHLQREGGIVTIGTDYNHPDFKLAVDGKVICEEVRVQLDGAWPDYVFSDEYDLMELTELESYITTNHHLPGIPAAAEVEASGIDMGVMNKTLVEKVEELSLYLIEMQKQNKALTESVEILQDRIETLEQ